MFIFSRLTPRLSDCSDAAHKVTLSESIRNNSKIQDELQAKINQQARELEDMREQLAKKEEDAQKRAKEVNAQSSLMPCLVLFLPMKRHIPSHCRHTLHDLFFVAPLSL